MGISALNNEFAAATGAVLITVILLWLLRWWGQGGQFKNKSARIDGKVIVITGCNTGIGKETVRELARRGGRIYMACRDSKKCEEARKEIIADTGNQNIFNRTLDLASLASVRKFAQEFLAEESRLDILINNAGVMVIPHSLTKDGFETQIGVNHLGHFLLTNLLLDRLKESTPARIINVASIAHLFGSINRKDLNSDGSYNRYNAYSHSKLANILFTRELSKRLHGTGVTVNSLHPGFVNTELPRNLGIFRYIAWLYLVSMAKTPRSGAQTTLMLALDPAMAKISGNYYSDCALANESAAARDDDTADWLWETSEEWIRSKSESSASQLKLSLAEEFK